MNLPVMNLPVMNSPVINARGVSSQGAIAPARAYRPDLDGLRALAILSVVLYHAGVPRLSGGFTGVDIFFVLSGYLIGGHIYAELQSGTFSFRSFYRRRARRILPAFFAAILFTLAAAMVLLSPVEAADLGRSSLAATLSASNVLFWGTTNYFTAKGSLNPMLMTWSLGVEEQFYAVVPLLMAWLARVRFNLMLPVALAVSLLSFAFAWAALGSHPMFVFYLLPARAWELGVGVALAVAEAKHNTRNAPLISVNSATLPLAANVAGITGMALMLAPQFVWNASSPFPGPAAVPSVLGAVLVIAARTGFINRYVLSLRPLVFLGKVSYSFYLWHWPMLAYLHILYAGEPPRTGRYAVIALSFSAAVLSYYFVEQPFRRGSALPSPVLRRYSIALAATAILCAAVWLSHGIPQRFPALAAMEHTSQSLQSDPCLAGYGHDSPDTSPACTDTGAASPALALWGDSHAAALSPGIRAAAHAQGYQFLELAKASCASLAGATHASPRLPLLAAECTHFNQRVFNLIAHNPRIRLVILNADWAGYLHRDWQDGWLSAQTARTSAAPTEEASSALFVSSLSATIAALQFSGRQVIVIKDVPSFDIDPLSRVRAQRIPARRILASWLGVRDAADPGFAAPVADELVNTANQLLATAVSCSSGSELLDLRPTLCSSPGQCIYRNGETLLFNDSNHLSTAGALYALRNVRLSPP